MRRKIGDALIIVHDAVSGGLLVQADAVLHNHQRQLIALGEHVEHVAQAHGVNLPAPVRSLDIGVLHLDVRLLFHVIGTRHAHVIGEGEIVHLAALQQFEVAIGHLDVAALVLPLLQDIGGVMAAALYVAVVEAAVHLLQRRHLVHGLAGGRIAGHHREHAADLEIRIDAMAHDDRLRRGHELMVCDLIEHGVFILARLVEHARVSKGGKFLLDIALVVDFVEGHPVLDLVLVAAETYLRETHEEVNQLAVAPAAVLRHQMIGQLEMRKRDHGLHAECMHRVKEVIVELQAGLVRLRLIAQRENTRPGDARAEALAPHIGEHFEVLFVVMIKVDGLVVRVVFARLHTIRDFTWLAGAAHGHDVGNAHALAALLPAAFELMGRHGTAPEETLRKCHLRPSSLSRRW